MLKKFYINQKPVIKMFKNFIIRCLKFENDFLFNTKLKPSTLPMDLVI